MDKAMFGTPHKGANAYTSVGVETGVASADPHKLIVMLFDGAIKAVSEAQHHMKTGNIAAKGQAISHAITIIDSGLRASLDKDVGGDIAVNLDALYQYIGNRLLVANLENKPELLDEAIRLLKELKGAWETIGRKQVDEAPATSTPIPPSATPHDPLSPRISRLVKA
jgi:flagellar protein FliS